MKNRIQETKRINLSGFLSSSRPSFPIFRPLSLPDDPVSLCVSSAIFISPSHVTILSQTHQFSDPLLCLFHPLVSLVSLSSSLSLFSGPPAPSPPLWPKHRTSCCYYLGIRLWWPLMSQQREEDGNQRRSLNHPSLQMEVFSPLWSAICLWSNSSTVWVWKQCQHWVINATNVFLMWRGTELRGNLKCFQNGNKVG